MADTTDFPKQGDDKAVSLRNSEYARFDLAFAQDLKDNHPNVWRKGGNIKGNAQYAILSRIAKQGGSPKTPAEEKAIRLREAWAARHYQNKRVPGVVAQIKWLVVGAIGERRMKDLMNDAKEKARGRTAEPGGPGVSGNAPAEQAGGGHDAAPDGLFVRAADVCGVPRRESRRDAASGASRGVVVVDFVASTESIDTYESILRANWDLKRYSANPVLLWMHGRMSDHPAVGIVENPRVENKQLLGRAVFDDSCEFDRMIADKYAKGILRGFSVGFHARTARVEVVNDREILILDDIELREISCVNVPSNPEALAMGQRRAFEHLRAAARAAGGPVDVRQALSLTGDVRSAAPAECQPDHTTAPERHGVTMPTQKKIVQPGERDVRSADDMHALDIACPHCEGPVEVQTRGLVTPKRLAEIEALTTRAISAETRAVEAEKKAAAESERAALLTSEKDAAEKRAAALEARVASVEGSLKVYRDARIASEIDKRVGAKIEPAERADEIAIAERMLADTAADPDKTGSTLGEKRWAERLARIDARRDLGMLTPPITGADGNKPNTGAQPVQQVSAIDEINAMARAA